MNRKATMHLSEADSIMLTLCLDKLKDIQPGMSSGRMMKMFFYSYLEWVTGRKAQNDLVDNIFKDAYEQRASGLLKKELQKLSDETMLSASEMYNFSLDTTEEVELHTAQKNMEVNLEEVPDARIEESWNGSFLSDDGTTEQGNGDFFS